MQWLIDIVLALCKTYTDEQISLLKTYTGEQLALCKTYTDEQIALQAHVPSGVIMAWSGLFSKIPAGWTFCDGSNGTPDLRNRFLKEILTSDQMGHLSGWTHHTHNFTGDGHQHGLGPGNDLDAGNHYGLTTGTVPATGTTDSVDGQPPFYKLAFIMKL